MGIYWKTQLDEFLHRPGRLSDLLDVLERKTHQDRLNIVLAASCVLFSLLLMGGDVGLMICTITRITYPTYCTINAIEKNNAEEKLRWAQFWIVENCLQLVEHFFSTLLTQVVPLYWLIRFTLLLWLMAPVKCNGASVLYNRLVKDNIEDKGEEIAPVDINV